MSDEPKTNQEANEVNADAKRDKKDEKKQNGFISKLLELRSEFRKIVWPSREILLKHTVTVVVVSLLFGAYIALTDGLFGLAFTSFVKLIS